MQVIVPGLDWSVLRKRRKALLESNLLRNTQGDATYGRGSWRELFLPPIAVPRDYGKVQVKE